MHDTKHLFRPLDTVEGPDLWDRIHRGQPLSDPGPSRGKGIVALVSALAITALIVTLLLAAFREAPRSGTATDPNPTLEVDPIHLGAPRALPFDEGVWVSAAEEAFGSMWVITLADDGDREQLQRLDIDSGEPRATFDIPVAGGREWGGAGITVGLGHVWVGAWNSATIFRIDPATDDVDAFRLDGRVVADIAVDASGALWASVAAKEVGALDIVHLDPSSGAILSSTPFRAEWSSGLLAAGGALWTLERRVANSTVQGGRLAQILPGSAPPVETGGSFALPVTDGTSIWTPYLGDRLAMNEAAGIARVDPTTGRILGEWRTPPIGYDIALGSDGGIWFLGERGLQRLNPATGEIDIRRSIEGTPIFLSASPEGIWVATYEGELIHFPYEPD